MTANPTETLGGLVHVLFTTPGEKVGASVAGLAISSPLWHDALHATSDTASMLAPILGCVWLLVQILHKVRQLLHPPKTADGED